MGFSSEYLEVASSDGRNFTLLKEVVYTAADGTVYIMPVGATSDGASTPSIVWPLIPPFGIYWKAAFLHDCAYRNTLGVDDKSKANPQIIPANLPKCDCDALLCEAMESLGVGKTRIDEIYEAVVVAGTSSFDSDRKIP